MIRGILFAVVFILVGAFLNSKHSPTNRVVDRIVDRGVELVTSAKTTTVGLASDIRHEVSQK